MQSLHSLRLSAVHEREFVSGQVECGISRLRELVAGHIALSVDGRK